MRFIVDESSGSAISAYLHGLGHDSIYVGNVMPQAEDKDILARAAAEERIVITNDKDFGELAFRTGAAHAGVLLLRLHDESPANRVRVTKAVLERWADRLPGAFTVATEAGVRIRSAATSE